MEISVLTVGLLVLCLSSIMTGTFDSTKPYAILKVRDLSIAFFVRLLRSLGVIIIAYNMWFIQSKVHAIIGIPYILIYSYFIVYDLAFMVENIVGRKIHQALKSEQDVNWNDTTQNSETRDYLGVFISIPLIVLTLMLN